MLRTKINCSLTYGVGINDADYQVISDVYYCPFYSRWAGVLERCYCPKYHKKQPTYVGCTIDDSWKSFMCFRSWMVKQDWQGKHLDKDLLGCGKFYSPSTCLFVSQRVNNFTTDRSRFRGSYPIGVDLHKGRIRARLGSHSHLGYFDTPEEAHNAWLVAKKELCVQLIAEQTDPRVAEGLIRYMEKLT